MKEIRVLQVFTVMNRGGAESMIMNYYRNIDRTKVQFDFLVHRKERGHFDDEIALLGGKIFRMQPIKFETLVSYQKELDRFFLLHNEYAIIHSHLNALSKFVLKKAMKFNVPIRIAHSHIALTTFRYQSFFRKDISFKENFKILFKTYIKKSVSKYATHYFACGIDAGNWLFGKENIHKVSIINNAIDASKFEYNAEVSKKNKRELSVENKLVIGHIGRFNTQKNHLFLIDIFKEIQKIQVNSVLLLIGEGDLMSAVKEKIKSYNLENAVHLLGVKSDVSYYLQAMDIFLFPSLYEGLPVTLIEAQAAGLKVITSENVSKEAKLTNLVEFVSLEKPATYWATKVLECFSEYERPKTFSLISESGYDIKVNALELQQFYLKKS